MFLSLLLGKLPREKLQKMLPPRYIIMYVLTLLVLLCIGAFVFFYPTLRIRHPFWSAQPVARPNWVMTSQGKMQRLHKKSQEFSLPPGYRLEHITSLETRSETDPLWGEILMLWQACAKAEEHSSTHGESDGTTDVPVPELTSSCVYWALQHPGAEVFIVREGVEPVATHTSTSDSHSNSKSDDNTGGNVVACLVSVPSTVDTPVEHNVPMFLIDKLHVHPAHRGQRIVPAIVSSCIKANVRSSKADSTERHPSTSSASSENSENIEPIGLFAVELDFASPHQNRLPFSDVARVMRVYQTLSPTMLIDPHAEVSYRVVQSSKKCPSKFYESSEYRRTSSRSVDQNELACLFGKSAAYRTLEPSVGTDSRKAWCKYVIKHPNHSLLSVGGTDWIHLTHHPTASKKTPSEHMVSLLGTSFDRDQLDMLPKYVYAFIRKKYGSRTETTSVSLVIPHGLKEFFERSPSAPRFQEDLLPAEQGVRTGVEDEEDTSVIHEDEFVASERNTDGSRVHSHQNWTFYDAHYIYMHNYRLNQKSVLLPHTFDLPIY